MKRFVLLTAALCLLLGSLACTCRTNVNVPAPTAIPTERPTMSIPPTEKPSERPTESLMPVTSPSASPSDPAEPSASADPSKAPEGN